MLLPDIAIFCSILQLQGKKSWFNLDHDRVRVEIWVRLLVYKKEFWKLEIFNFQNHIWHPSHLPDVHDCNPNCTNQIHVTQVPVDLRCGRGRRRCRHVRVQTHRSMRSRNRRILGGLCLSMGNFFVESSNVGSSCGDMGTPKSMSTFCRWHDRHAWNLVVKH